MCDVLNNVRVKSIRFMILPYQFSIIVIIAIIAIIIIISCSRSRNSIIIMRIGFFEVFHQDLALRMKAHGLEFSYKYWFSKSLGVSNLSRLWCNIIKQSLLTVGNKGTLLEDCKKHDLNLHWNADKP